VTYLAPPGYAATDVEAQRRADEFREHDPFPEIPAALLSSEHIADYVQATGMLWPFYPDKERLKSASYEARAQRFIRWDIDGRKIITDLTKEAKYVLPENSITFVQIESKIRLPDYIALRFNLRIRHVHRGLLLGTGPLVDPGFKGDLLIPLHNLTSEPYEIDGTEGIIWIEFTKTSHNLQKSSARSSFFPIQQRKTNVGFEYYFERANNNNPIQSSIPQAVKEAREKSREAERSARAARRTNRWFAGIGVVALVGLVIALLSYFEQSHSSIMSTYSQASTASERASEAMANAARALDENREIKKALEDTQRHLTELQRELESMRRTVPSGQSQGGSNRP
jgi:deoxycytidine triphosphate deaminase